MPESPDLVPLSEYEQGSEGPFLIMVHGDGQAAQGLDGLVALAQTRPGSQIFVVAAPGSPIAKSAEAAMSAGHPVVLARGVNSSLRGNVRSVFLVELGRKFELFAKEHLNWVIISHSAEVRSLAERLEAMGLHALTVGAEPTPDLLESLTGEGGMTQLLLGIFQMAYKEKRGRLHIEDFTKRVLASIPELNNPMERRRLFGTKRFNRIAYRIGLGVEHGGMMKPAGDLAVTGLFDEAVD